MRQKKWSTKPATATMSFFVALTAVLGAQAPSTIKPLLDNERVTVWDLTSADAVAEAQVLQIHDAVVVYLTPDSVRGKVEFAPKGVGVVEKLKASGATRIGVISLKDLVVPELKNRSGYPDAFPRPGNNKKVLDNAKVTVWDYTFAPNVPTPMHFHGKDTVVIFLTGGNLVSTTPDGEKSINDFLAGSIQFRRRDRTHTETLTKGEGHIIATELK